MGKQEFFEKFGKNKKARAQFNAAIRAEYPGGNELLELLELVSHMRHRATNREESNKLEIIEDRLQGIRDTMVDDIKIKYDF